MREIKFRVWSDVWHEMMFAISIDFNNNFVEVLPPAELEGGSTQLLSFDQIELMQFTGFKDKNGIEIYEGDILSNGVEWCNAEIKFDKGCFMWNNEPIGFNGDDDGYTDSPPSTWGEVIGNIYEHQNLLS